MKPRTAIFLLTLALATMLAAAGVALAADMPSYDEENRLLLPADWRQWILVGSALGLSYGEQASDHPLMHNVLMKPDAYNEYVQSGEFPEGTMLALLLLEQGEAVKPGRHGTFGSELLALEMAVKDHDRLEEGWGYYTFSGPAGLMQQATPFGKAMCHDCHAEHADDDNVFTQFYALLRSARAAAGGAPATAATAADATAETEPAAAVAALSRFDPIGLLTAGERIEGREDLYADYRGFRYFFASPEHRQRFLAEPATFAIQNETCPVVPGAPIDPSLFSVHAGKVYAFASPTCVSDFEADPDSYL